ncbi:alpha/beta fold hydrolase [Candidatus Acetothermia bacterium]|nr:alpha/beta fold hydrolase [Candidatus Acetothermia bacterium]MBI3642591.1 alpha/beta fold hydrolase [Candidatus Acetothermia bacterium]
MAFKALEAARECPSAWEERLFQLPSWIPLGEFVDVGGLRTHVVVKGDGSPIILLHGFASYGYSWRHNIDALAESHCVYALDMPGFGLSDKPAKHDYSLSAQAGFVLAFMDAMHLDRVALAGNSMGGGVALEFAVRFPERLSGLIIISSVGLRPDRLPRWIRKMAAQLVKGGSLSGLFVPGPKRLRWIMEYLYHDPSKIETQDIKAFLLPMQTSEFRQALCAMIETLHLELADVDRIEMIKIPTLVLWGQEDRVLSPAHAFQFSSVLQNSQMKIISNAGHALIQEQPRIVNEQMVQFLKQIDSQASQR